MDARGVQRLRQPCRAPRVKHLELRGVAVARVGTRAGGTRSVTVVSSSGQRPKDRYFTLRGNALKRWVRIHLWVYRTTRGRLLAKMRGMPTLLLTTTGRRSGRRHTVPLPYFTDGAGKVVIGSFAGSDRHPAWVLNVIADPVVDVQDRGDTYPGRAELVTGEERAALWADLVERSPWYADYQQQTSREIPLVRITDARAHSHG